MNRAYKLVWNTVSNSWTVASELAKGRKKSSSTALKLAVLLASGLTAGMASAAPAANALPSGESVAAGVATFDRTVSKQLTVNQLNPRLITNWSSFDVGSDGKVIFAQPDAASVALNRVTGGSASEIFGQVTANGQLVIVNPNGITFGAGSQVSAASIIGSVLDIQDGNFLLTNMLFERGAATGSIDNKGSLTASAGSVSLLAPSIKNSGSITATGGNASLINANVVNLSTVDPAISTASTITGLIQQSGSITATQVSSVGGKILLRGDTSQSASQIQLAGTLDATTNTNINGRNIVVTDNADLNGSSNVLDFSSTDGYSLNSGSAVNLNGASSGFSVNGSAYTVVRNITQLQNMALNLGGNYVLGLNIDASATINWNAGMGFVPVGSTSGAFSGNIEGLGHAVNALSIQRPATDYVGLVGYTLEGSIRHLGISNASIVGANYTGGLLGAYSNGGVVPIVLQGNWVTGSVTGLDGVGGLIGSLSNSFQTTMLVNKNYVNASVQGNNNVGSLVGNAQITLLSIPNTDVTISNNYIAGTVLGNDSAGGLIGSSLFNELIGNTSVYSIKDNLITATVVSSNNTGGLLGANMLSSIVFGSNGFKLSQNYVAGGVAGVTNIGALVGQNNMSFGFNAPFNNNFWNTQSTTQMFGIGLQVGSPVFTGYTGISSTQAMQLATFASWGADIDATAGTGSTWRIYDGLSGPLLRSFLKPLTIGGDQSKTYDGTTLSSPTLSYSRNIVDFSKILGTASVSGTAVGARNVGSYSLNVSGGLYSTDQFGYDIGFASGTLNISAANLTISSSDVSKTYDATTSANGSAVVTAGSLFGTDSMSGGTFAFADKNAGTGKTVMVSGVMVNDGNGGNNYNITYADNTSSTINKRLLTISAAADSKVYDGKLTSSASAKPTVVGRQRGDSIVGLTQSYLDKNAGTGKTINVDAGYTIRDGNGGNNYNVVIVNSTAGVITPKALTISTVANSKVYDGGVTSASKPVVTGLLTGDRVTGLFQQYDSKTVGTGKKLLIKAGYVLQDGNGGNNYTVTEQGSMDGVISAN